MTDFRTLCFLAAIGALCAGQGVMRPAAAQGLASIRVAEPGRSVAASPLWAAAARAEAEGPDLLPIEAPAPPPDLVASFATVADRVPMTVGVTSLLASVTPSRTERRMLDRLMPGLGAAARIYRVSAHVSF